MPKSHGPKVKSPTRKERERATRRQDIVRAARQVFASRGFNKATLDEIASRAEYGKGTLYNYFDSKDQLFAAAMDDLFHDVRQIADAVIADGDGLRETLMAFTERILDYYRENYAFCRLLMREWVRPETTRADKRVAIVQARVRLIAAPFARFMRTAIRRGEMQKGDPEVYSKLFMGLIHHYYMHVAALNPPQARRAIRAHARLIVRLFLDGAGVHGRAR